MNLCRYNLHVAQKENKRYNLKRKNVAPRKKGETKKSPDEKFVLVENAAEMKRVNKLCPCGRLTNKVSKQCFICYKKRILKFTKTQLIKDLKEIKSLTHVGKKYGISANAIVKSSKKFKVNYKQYILKTNRYNPKDNKKIISYYRKCKHIGKTAQHFKITPGIVSTLVKDTPTYQAKINHLKEVKVLKDKIKNLKAKYTFSEISKKLGIPLQRAKSLYYS